MFSKSLKDIDLNISVEECFKELRPHPKFRNCTFDNYIPDDKYPSQNKIKNLLQEISSKQNIKRMVWYSFFQKIKQKKLHKNIYIDGTYGIGKTHLLSACYNNFKGKKSFLSFMELSYFMNYAGLEKTIDVFKNVELLLLDEFDLDDPATTRMACRFIDALKERTTIITTSNRLPNELGGGKFDTDCFARELGIISNLFDVVTVDGKSYRIHLADWQAKFCSETFSCVRDSYECVNGKLLTNQNELMKILNENHPFKFFVIPKNFDGIFIEDFIPFVNLNDALRFAIFIDHCYYYNTKLFFNSNVKGGIFSHEMKSTAFERNFLRCESRLDEIGLFFRND